MVSAGGGSKKFQSNKGDSSGSALDSEGSGGRWEDAPGTVPREEPARPVKAPPGPTAARAIGHPTWPTVLAVALFVRAQFCDLQGPSRSLSDNNSVTHSARRRRVQGRRP